MGCGKRYWGTWDCEGSGEKWKWTVFPHPMCSSLLVVVKPSVALATRVYINILFYLLIYKRL